MTTNRRSVRRSYVLAHALLASFASSCGSDSGSTKAPVTQSAGSAGEPMSGGTAATPAEPTEGSGAGSGEAVPGEIPLQNPPGTAGTSGPDVPPTQPDDGLCPAAARSASGYCWQSVAMGGGGFVSGVVFSASEPNLIYARTDVGGAYRWDEAAARWLPLTDWVAENQVGFLGIESIALDPSEPHRLYMLAGIDYFDGGKTAILSSADYGQSFDVHEVTNQFKAHGNGAGRQNGERLAVDPNNGSKLYVGTRSNGLFRSDDRGATWARVAAVDVTTTPTGNGIAFVSFDARSGVVAGATRTIYVGVSRVDAPNLLASQDGGVTWNPVPGQPSGQAPQRAALAPDGELLITYGNGAGPNGTPQNRMNDGAIWAFNPGTGSWREITPQTNGNHAFSGISIDRANPRRLLSSSINTYQEQPWGYGDRFFLSTNGGESWVDLIAADRVQMDTNGMPWIEQHAMHWAGVIEIDPFNPERAMVTSGNGIFMTQNLSAPSSTWTFAARGLEETVPLDAVSVRGAPLVSVIGDYDGFIHHDLGVSPAQGTHNPQMGTTSAVAMAALAPQRVARAGAELYVSSDAGQTWQAAERPSTQTGGRLAYSADGAVLLWAAGANAYRSANQGTSWTTVAGLPGTSAPAADAVNSSKFYAYEPAGAFYVSTDGGLSFNPGATLPNGGSRRIRTAPGVEGDVWVALNGGGLTRSVTSGATFERIAAVGSCRAVGFGAAPPSATFPAVYIWGSADGGPRGIYRSDNAGASWQRINDDAHQYGGPGNGEFILGDANVYGRVFMSTAGRGIAMGELIAAAGAED